MKENRPDGVIEQRVRNRIIEYLELVLSFEQQRSYQTAVPCVSVSNELISQWEDWVPFENPRGHFQEPVFSWAEQEAICGYHSVWNMVVAETPAQMPPLEQLIGLDVWERLRYAAEEALQMFHLRGRLPEDEAIA